MGTIKVHKVINIRKCTLRSSLDLDCGGLGNYLRRNICCTEYFPTNQNNSLLS